MEYKRITSIEHELSPGVECELSPNIAREVFDEIPKGASDTLIELDVKKRLVDIRREIVYIIERPPATIAALDAPNIFG